MRERDVEIMAGVVSPRGRDRAKSIAGCGRMVCRTIDGEPRVVMLPCRDAACTPCQVRRSVALGADLRAWVCARVLASARLYFITLTPPKPHGHDPRLALDATRRAWRRLVNRALARGREFAARVLGFLRVVEITWSAAGTPRKHGGNVAYDGYHAHIHALIELADGDDAETLAWIIAQWCELTGGVAAAQHATPALDEHVAYVAKYMSKAIGEMPVARARALHIALYSRRMHQGGGTWLKWRQQVKPDEPSVEVGVPVDGQGERVSLKEIVDLALNAATRDSEIRFVPHRTVRVGSAFETVYARMPAHRVLEGLRRDVKSQVKADADAEAKRAAKDTS